MTPEIKSCFERVHITDSSLQHRILSENNVRFDGEACFMKCILENDGVITSEGLLSPAGAKDIADRVGKPISDDQITKCQKQAEKSGSDICQSAMDAVDCLSNVLRK